MERLRHSAFSQVLTGFLTLSLGVVIASPVAYADGTRVDYGDWLRLHVPLTGRPNVERAIRSASERGARSFDEFLDHFGEELRALRPSAIPVGEESPFEEPTDAQIQELRLEYTRFVGEGVLDWRSGPASDLPEPNRTGPAVIGSVPVSAGCDARTDGPRRVEIIGLRGLFEHSTIQPLGP